MVWNKKLYWAFLVPILWVANTYCNDAMAQNYDFRRYSVTEWLPQVSVSDMLQDDTGFGTLGGGLSRFDGTHFKTFTRKNGLRDNIINAILEDSNQNFWVGTDRGGVGIFKDDTLRYQFQNSPLDTVTTYNIVESPDGRIWFATYGAGVFIYDGATLEQLTVEDGLSSNFTWDFSFNDDGSVFIGTLNGLSIYNPSNGEKSQVQTITDAKKIGEYAIYDFLKDEEGTLWFSTNTGVTKYKDGKFETIDQIDGITLGFTYALQKDRWGNIWIGTSDDGIFRQFGGQQFHHVTTQNGLSSNRIYSMYKDLKGNIWVGTSDDGANIYQGDMVTSFSEPADFGVWSILSVYALENGKLLVGTAGHGLWEISGATGAYDIRKFGLNNKDIWVIDKLKNGHLLLLTGDNTIYEYSGGRLTNYDQKIGLLPVPYTIDLFVDSKDRVWIGTNEGLYCEQDGRLIHYDESNGLADNFVWETTELNHKIWISTNDGLSLMQVDSLTNFTQKNGLINDVVSTVVSDDSSKICIGTTGGIAYIDSVAAEDSLRFEKFDRDDGLQFVDTQLLAFDSLGNLWQGTNGGLQMLDINAYKKTGKLKVTRFSLDNTGKGREFAHKAVATDTSGALWFGTTSGLLRYNPKRLQRRSAGPDTKIQNLKLNFRHTISLKNLSESNEITFDHDSGQAELSYDQDNITFSFNAFEFKNPETVKYRYRLKGFDKKWSQANEASFATFTNLGANDYVFEVQSQNNHGIWGKTASFPFTISPPFWNTYWFYLFAFCLGAAICYAFISARVNYIERNHLDELVDKQTRDLTEALQEKEVLIKEIHHRVKNNLAVICGLFELQLDHISDNKAEKALKESQRRVLSISMIHEKLYQNDRLSEIDFPKYIRELTDIIAASYSYDSNNIVIEVDINDSIQLSIDQGIPCGLILNELVSNAFKHAFEEQSSGEITIRFQKENHNIAFEIADNGNGFEYTEGELSRTSLGLTLVESLVKQLNGTLEVSSNNSGSTFTINFDDTLS